MKKYPSKISFGLVVFLLVVIIGTSIPLISPPIWSGLIINLLILAFISYLFLTTYYVIDGDLLTIKSGFIVNMKVDIKTIGIIAETNSLVSSPAASLDRLNIIYNEHSSVLISPRDKSGFIDHITRINPKIVVQYISGKKKH